MWRLIFIAAWTFFSHATFSQENISYHKYLNLDKEVSRNRARFRYSVIKDENKHLEVQWFDMVNYCIRSKKIYDEFGYPTGIWVFSEKGCLNTDSLDFTNIKYANLNNSIKTGSAVLGNDSVLVHASYSLGDDALFKYLASSINYPLIAANEDLSGIVYLTFVVRLDGSFSNIEVLQGCHPYLDLEAFRVVSAIPGAWTPAKNQNGEHIESRLNIPIKFSFR